MTPEELNSASLSLSKRAESYDDEHLTRSFVSLGSIPKLLTNNDSAIIFGRRGTGKTHLLSYVSTSVNNAGVVVASIDMRTIGSSSGLYADQNIPLQERATKLLRDTVVAIHQKIYESYISSANLEFGPNVIEALDTLLTATTEVKVDGVVSNETQASVAANESVDANFGMSAGVKGAQFDLGGKSGLSSAYSTLTKQGVSGRAIARVNFGSLSTAVNQVVSNMPKKRLWLLLDEWSAVPMELQPYLADMIRRGFLAIKGVTAKFAAIEHRSSFRKVSEDGLVSIGIELGADVSTSLNLDEHMVFENDPLAASAFFSEMLFRHIKASTESDGLTFDIASKEDLVKGLFTQKDAFEEFVMASEGVPRDALNILLKCALKAGKEKISTPIIRESARSWFLSSKQIDVSSRATASKLLQWIVDEVIRNRKARGFLLNIKSRDDLIDFLFDSRVIHIIKRGVSSKESPGEKYNVFTLDYGCYVDLINSSFAPKGLFEATEEEASAASRFVDVPHTDYRSIRRAILSLDEFHKFVT